jgi:hypothetical protein
MWQMIFGRMGACLLLEYRFNTRQRRTPWPSNGPLDDLSASGRNRYRHSRTIASGSAGFLPHFARCGRYRRCRLGGGSNGWSRKS